MRIALIGAATALDPNTLAATPGWQRYDNDSRVEMLFNRTEDGQIMYMRTFTTDTARLDAVSTCLMVGISVAYTHSNMTIGSGEALRGKPRSRRERLDTEPDMKPFGDRQSFVAGSEIEYTSTIKFSMYNSGPMRLCCPQLLRCSEALVGQ